MTTKQKDELLIRIEERQNAMYEIQVKSLAQQVLTNGRVTSLEKWKNYLVGAGLVIITLLGWLFQVK